MTNKEEQYYKGFHDGFHEGAKQNNKFSFCRLFGYIIVGYISFIITVSILIGLFGS